jgi:hypothetical protein
MKTHDNGASMTYSLIVVDTVDSKDVSSRSQICPASVRNVVTSTYNYRALFVPHLFCFVVLLDSYDSDLATVAEEPPTGNKCEQQPSTHMHTKPSNSGHKVLRGTDSDELVQQEAEAPVLSLPPSCRSVYLIV